MGLDINIHAIAKEKVTSVVKENEISYITNDVLQGNGKTLVFYSRKNEFLKKELQNAVHGTITEGDDYIGHGSNVIIDDLASARLQARIETFEEDIPAAIELIKEMYDLQSFHAAVVAFSELMVCVSEITRSISRDKFYFTFSWNT